MDDSDKQLIQKFSGSEILSSLTSKQMFDAFNTFAKLKYDKEFRSKKIVEANDLFDEIKVIYQQIGIDIVEPKKSEEGYITVFKTRKFNPDMMDMTEEEFSTFLKENKSPFSKKSIKTKLKKNPDKVIAKALKNDKIVKVSTAKKGPNTQYKLK